MSDDQGSPLDRGFVVVQPTSNGMSRVLVCDAVDGAEPRNVYAVHFKCKDLRVHPGAQLVKTGPIRYSRQLVEVFSDSPGVVHIRRIRRGESAVLNPSEWKR